MNERDTPDPVLLPLAVAAGVLAGLGAVFFHFLLALIHNAVFLGRADFFYDPRQHSPSSPWGAAIILAPALGGLAAVFLTRRFAPESQGSGVPDILAGIFYHQGRIRPVQALFQPIASALSIGSGGSAGREGPSMHIGAALASGLARGLRLRPATHIALVACGTAAGIAASFNAPWGGWLFALEIAAPEWRPLVVFATLAAAWAGVLVSRLFFGNFQLLAVTLPPRGIIPQDWWVCLVLGILTGLTAWLFIITVHRVRKGMGRAPGNAYLKHTLAMLVVGGIIYAFWRWTGHYAVEGVGYASAGDLLGGVLPTIGILAALFAAKFLATVLTLGTGGSGGIFSPSLFLGAALGAVAAALLAIAGVPVPAFLWVLVGMGGMVAATTGAVLGSAVMIAEMAGHPEAAVPALLAAITAYAVRRALLPQSGYTRSLADGPWRVPENHYARFWQAWCTRRKGPISR